MHAATPVLEPTMSDAPSSLSLDFYASNSRMLLSFVKIMQSFILMQNIWKRDWKKGGENFGSIFFQKKCQFWPILPAAQIF